MASKTVAMEMLIAKRYLGNGKPFLVDARGAFMGSFETIDELVQHCKDMGYNVRDEKTGKTYSSTDGGAVKMAAGPRWTCPLCHDVFYPTSQLDQGRFIPPHQIISGGGWCVSRERAGEIEALRDGDYSMSRPTVNLHALSRALSTGHFERPPSPVKTAMAIVNAHGTFKKLDHVQYKHPIRGVSTGIIESIAGEDGVRQVMDGEVGIIHDGDLKRDNVYKDDILGMAP